MPPTLKERMFSDPLRDKKYRSISSHSCTDCGYLEVYAK
jgi:predicted nucleic-acid-binding Zn-ribbon protein